MYASVKKLSLACGILTAVNIFATILFLFAIPGFNLSFAFEFTVGTLLAAASLISLLLTISLHNLCDLLELDFENKAGKIREIEIKIRQIEERV